jgi:hypothetical protein
MIEETRLQEGTNEISLYQFFKKNRWGGLTSSPTNVGSRDLLGIEDYQRKSCILILHVIFILDFVKMMGIRY